MTLRSLVITVIIFVCNPLNSMSQDSIHESTEIETERLIQLNKPTGPIAKYVNFDVIKILAGAGWTNGSFSSSGLGPCFELQLMWPYSFQKNSPFFHFVAGLTFGYNTISWTKLAPNIVDNKLVTFSPNTTINRIAQKTGYIGIPIFALFQFGHFRKCEIMAGPAIHFNILGSRTIVRSDSLNKTIFTFNDIHKISVQCMLQFSYRLGTCSLGVYYSYDLIPRFKSQDLKNIKQNLAGISAAIKI